MNNDKQHGEFQNIDDKMEYIRSIDPATADLLQTFFDDLLIEMKRVRGELPPEEQDDNE